MRDCCSIQYLRENSNGTRERVSSWIWAADKATKNYRQLIAEGTILIYKLA